MGKRKDKKRAHKLAKRTLKLTHGKKAKKHETKRIKSDNKAATKQHKASENTARKTQKYDAHKTAYENGIDPKAAVANGITGGLNAVGKTVTGIFGKGGGGGKIPNPADLINGVLGGDGGDPNGGAKTPSFLNKPIEQLVGIGLGIGGAIYLIFKMFTSGKSR